MAFVFVFHMYLYCITQASMCAVPATVSQSDNCYSFDLLCENALTFDLLHQTLLRLRAEADLRIGELQWGDSGVYYCKVVIADDLEGKNEAQLELLVLGMPAPHFLSKYSQLPMPDCDRLGKSFLLNDLMFSF